MHTDLLHVSQEDHSSVMRIQYICVHNKKEFDA